ncbi:MAG: HXXEE domain-containing protein [Rhizobiales bacterium]|nr:HXXEE domain-containing protein [Hyphomicrobiales bacterium]
MDLSRWMWLATAAYGIHVLEEFSLDWREWARSVIGLPVEWSDFYLVNALVVVLGIVAANLADAAPAVALAYPALMLINAIFFHIAPFIWTRGRFSPGLFTAVAFFLPIGFGCYWQASREGALNAGVVTVSIVIGALLMASPIVLLKLKRLSYFRQDRP